MPTPVLLAWSGGKDSALTLQALRADPAYEVVALLTTLGEDDARIAMHRVRRDLIEQQAAAAGLPLHPVYVPAWPSNDTYEKRMQAALQHFQAQGVNTCAFGDLFLADIRTYREHNLAQIGMQASFPLWELDTTALARRFVADGFKAVIVSVDSAQLDPAFIGRTLDAACLDDLPPGVDPCGENGEFHTFVYDGPIFTRPIAWQPGATTAQDGFHYHDLLPG